MVDCSVRVYQIIVKNDQPFYMGNWVVVKLISPYIFSSKSPHFILCALFDTTKVNKITLVL